jgi:hypothetical protein
VGGGQRGSVRAGLGEHATGADQEHQRGESLAELMDHSLTPVRQSTRTDSAMSQESVDLSWHTPLADSDRGTEKYRQG